MRRKLPVMFILMTVVVDAMGIGLIMPVMPNLLLEIRAGSLANAALWGGVMSASFAVMQFLFGPIIGNLSDRFGRRPILLTSLAVMAADYLVMALAGSIWLLLAGRIVGGITAATQSTAAAFMADISSPEKRGAGFGLVSAAFGLGFVLGPLMGGLLGDLGTRAPFYAAALLAFSTLTFGWFILPETVGTALRRPFNWKRANPLGAFRSLAALPGQGRLLMVVFLYQLAFNVYPSIWPYFTLARFNWSPRMIGVSLAVFGISLALVQGGLIRVALAHLGEVRVIILAFGFALLSFLVLAFISNGLLALALTPVSALAAMATPALQSLMSRQTPDDAQGELQGLFTSVGALSLILSPLLMTNVFAAFTAPDAVVYLPGAPFLASMVLAAAGLILFLTREKHR
jgi:DHA1 family tetracycline resistance protein-like MFS transporter